MCCGNICGNICSVLCDLTSMGLLLTTTNMMLLVCVALRTPKSRRFSFRLGGRTRGCSEQRTNATLPPDTCSVLQRPNTLTKYLATVQDLTPPSWYLLFKTGIVIIMCNFYENFFCINYKTELKTCQVNALVLSLLHSDFLQLLRLQWRAELKRPQSPHFLHSVTEKQLKQESYIQQQLSGEIDILISVMQFAS